MCPVSSSTATHPRTYLYPSLHRADRVRHDVGDSPTDATGSESADLGIVSTKTTVPRILGLYRREILDTYFVAVLQLYALDRVAPRLCGVR